MPKRRVKDVALNEKQKAFCEYYAACFNATEAAKKAGTVKRQRAVSGKDC